MTHETAQLTGPATDPAKVCDNASVGVIVTGPAGYLVFDRATFPAGVAPAAGHVFDDHPGYVEAAHAEVAEELGLTLTCLELVTGGWWHNRCRRAPGPRGIGHQWQVFTARVLRADAFMDPTGERTLAPSARETRNVRWATTDQLQALAERTAAHAHGLITAAEFTTLPGLEPVWVLWLTAARIITATPDDLTAIDDLTTRPNPMSRKELHR